MTVKNQILHENLHMYELIKKYIYKLFLAMRDKNYGVLNEEISHYLITDMYIQELL